MKFLWTRLSFRPEVVALAFGLGLTGFAGGCSSGDQTSEKVDNKMPKAWEVTKKAMQERQKQMMRKQGGPSRRGP